MEVELLIGASEACLGCRQAGSYAEAKRLAAEAAEIGDTCGMQSAGMRQAARLVRKCIPGI